MKDALEYTAHISEDGTMRIVNRKHFDQAIKRFAGKDVELVIQKKRAIRSNPQNRYWWGIVVPLVMAGMNDTGNELNKEETHDFLKQNFNYKEIVNEETGEVFRVAQSTTRLSKSEFSELVEKVKRFSAMYLNVEIPDANSDLALFNKAA